MDVDVRLGESAMLRDVAVKADVEWFSRAEAAVKK